MLSATERQAEIIQTTKSAGHVSVAQLAQHFTVTPETIRRDLKFLESQGRLVRVHGGAVSVSPNQDSETEYISNVQLNLEQKHRIAQAAWNRLKQFDDLSSIAIDSGSTTAELARTLCTFYSHLGNKRLTIITNSLPVAGLTADAGINNVHVVGGRIRPLTRAIVGDRTVGEFDALRTGLAVIGTNGLSMDHGCSTPDPYEASVKAAMVRSSRVTMVLCDSSKFAKDFLVTFASLDSIDIIVTDSDALPQHIEALRGKGIEVIVA